MFVGEQAGEGVDRASLELPDNQDQLISAVADANPNTTVGDDRPGRLCDAVAEQGQVSALHGVPRRGVRLVGSGPAVRRREPVGKLAVTFPASETQENGTNDKSVYPGLPAQDHPVTNGSDDPQNQSDDVHQIANVFYKDGLDVGYRYYVSNHLDPLFRFGYGLSYTSFAERVVGVIRTGNGDVILDVKVTNTGPRDGKQVVEGYVGDPQGTGEPALQLKAFEKVSVAAGQSTIAHLGFAPRAFAYWSDRATARFPNGQWKVDPGTYSLNIATDADRQDIVDRVRVHVPRMTLDPTSFANDQAEPVIEPTLSRRRRATAVTLQAATADDGPAAGSIQYQLDGSHWQTYGGPIRLPHGHRRHTLSYRVIDEYQNSGPVDTVRW